MERSNNPGSSSSGEPAPGWPQPPDQRLLGTSGAEYAAQLAAPYHPLEPGALATPIAFFWTLRDDN